MCPRNLTGECALTTVTLESENYGFKMISSVTNKHRLSRFHVPYAEAAAAAAAHQKKHGRIGSVKFSAATLFDTVMQELYANNLETGRFSWLCINALTVQVHTSLNSLSVAHLFFATLVDAADIRGNPACHSLSAICVNVGL